MFTFMRATNTVSYESEAKLQTRKATGEISKREGKARSGAKHDC
jgi:hypothetical protein